MRRAVDRIKEMPDDRAAEIKVITGGIKVTKAGVDGDDDRASPRSRSTTRRARSRPARLPAERDRAHPLHALPHPERESDALTSSSTTRSASSMRWRRSSEHEMHRMLVDGIKYERLSADDPNAQWEMMLFEESRSS